MIKWSKNEWSKEDGKRDRDIHELVEKHTWYSNHKMLIEHLFKAK